jgi:cAMP-dependent protein kinase regulator
MFEKKVESNETIIRQGEEGDNFYVVDQGIFDIYVNMQKVIQIGPGGSFGELALMYNTPRAATVIATTPGILWGVDRVTFRNIITSIAFQKRKLYRNFLKTVPILASLRAPEVTKICDALEPITYEEGDVVIEQGSVADYFYIIEQGEASVTKIDDQGVERKVLELKPGDYFGGRRDV